MIALLRTLVVSVVIALAGRDGFADTIHVPADYPTIQEAIDAAVDGDELVVAPGSYWPFEAFILGKSIVLRSTDPDDPEVVAATTIHGLILVGGGDQGTVIDGFSFDKYGDFLHTSLLIFGPATVRNCVWDGVDVGSSLQHPGILSISGGPVVVERCRFSNNYIWDGNSMIACDSGVAPVLIENVISGNISPGGSSWYGVHSEEGCNPTLIGTLMCGNPNTMTPVLGPWTDGGGNTLEGDCPCPADVDLDGVVGFGDLLVVLAEWGSCSGCPADVDNDGEVGFSDLLILLSSWGPCA